MMTSTNGEGRGLPGLVKARGTMAGGAASPLWRGTVCSEVGGTLSVIEVLCGTESATLSELAERLEIHPFSLHRILSSLTQRGYIEEQSSGGYGLTRRLEELAEASSRRRL